MIHGNLTFISHAIFFISANSTAFIQFLRSLIYEEFKIAPVGLMGICLTIPQHSKVKPFLPYLVAKKFTFIEKSEFSIYENLYIMSILCLKK